ncbi:MAG: hypothetical protein K5695_08390 [Oscillospiraceae bacterium]|nr:hypothetical protein [Oscillospiraceae bacterium]
MISAFTFAPAGAFLRTVSTAEDAAALLETRLQTFADAMYAIDDAERSERIPEDLCIEVWLCGILLDAAANDTDYAQEAAQAGLEDVYRTADRAVREAFARTTGVLFFKKPLHDLREAASLADDCLLMLEHEDYTELGKRLAGTDAREELIETVSGLNIRLEDHSDPQD